MENTHEFMVNIATIIENIYNIKNLTKYYYTLDIALGKMSSHIKVYFVWDKKF